MCVYDAAMIFPAPASASKITRSYSNSSDQPLLGLNSSSLKAARRSGSLHRVRFVLGAFDARLFVYYFKLADAAGFLWKHFTGAGIRHFTGQSLHRFTIPLPLLAEQVVIVERIEALMTTCQALEAEIEQARSHAAQLLQSVLKEAFTPT